MDDEELSAPKITRRLPDVAQIELAILALLTLNVYGRIWLWITQGSTINPGVAIAATTLAVFTYWYVYRSSQHGPSSIQDIANQRFTLIDHTQCQSSTFMSWGMLSLGVGLSVLGICSSWAAYKHLAFAPLDHQAQHAHNLGLLCEGAGVIGLWSAWSWSQVNELGGISGVIRLHFPISIAVFGLPWEGILRTLDEPLQRLSTDIAVIVLDLLDLFSLCDSYVHYWDAFTIYSDQFYLIINETCAGVNLLLSMSLYALGFGWVMGVSLSRAWILVAYIIPLSIIFNGVRIAVIFILGHSGSVELATGPWHEGSGYLCQVVLFILIALINQWLNQAPRSLKRGPSM